MALQWGDWILGPYRLLESLGEGGMAKVYLAEVLYPRAGLAPGDRVAIKILHQHLIKEPGSFERFRVEAELGIRLKHPNVVQTIDVGVTGSEGRAHHYLVMELVKGRTVRQVLEERRELSEDLCRRIGLEVTRALVAIHSLDIVHRDIKPENILIDEQGAVRIMDLGVAYLKSRTIRLSATGQFVGSVYYAAPEQILGGGKDLDARVDLYQLGLLLYEALTGIHPYRHQELGETLRRLVHYSPTGVCELNREVTPFLEAVVHKLLAKDRNERFSSAQRLLQILSKGEASDWWNRRRDTAGHGEHSRPRVRRQPRETPLHGRADELRDLRRWFKRALHGRGQSVLLEGEAGIGKSRLVEEFCDEVAGGTFSASLLFGNYAPGQDAAAEGAFSTAFREFLGDEELEAGLNRWLDRAQLLIPAFAALLRGTAPPPDAEELGRSTLKQLFGDLLAAIASRHPVVLVIEDLHHAHEGGLQLFEYLAKRVGDLPVVLIGTLRRGPLSCWAANLATSRSVIRRRLSRLSRADQRMLLFDALGSWRLADALLAKISEQSDGKPLYIFEILRDLRERQFIGIRPDGSWISTREIRELSIPATLKDLISARLADLSRDERRMLDLAACAGFEFDPRMLARAGGWGVVRALRIIASLQEKHRLLSRTPAGFSFDEHMIQETVYSGLCGRDREECHRALVSAILRDRDREGLSGAAAVTFCNHALRGRCPEHCLPHLDDALDHLASSHLNGPAVDLMERALRVPGFLVGVPRLLTLFRLTNHLDRLARRNREREVLTELKSLAEAHGSPRQQAQAVRFLGRHYQAVSSYRKACAEYRSAAALASRSGDLEEEAAAIGLLAIVHARLGECEQAAAYQETALELATACGSPHARHMHRGNLGIVFHGLGRYDEARQHHEEFLALAGVSDRPRDEMRHTERLGRALVAQGDYGEALAQLDRSLSVAFEIGDRKGEGIAYLSLGLVNRELGRTDEAERLLEQARCLFRQIGLVAGEAAAQYGLGRIAEDYGLVHRAETLYGESLSLCREIGTQGALVDSLVARGRLRGVAGKVKSATRDLTEARDLAERIRRPDSLVLAVSYLALLKACRRGVADKALAENPRIRQTVRMEAHHVLHKTTGEVGHLAAARELLNGLVDSAPAELRDSMRRNVPLHREIQLACGN